MIWPGLFNIVLWAILFNFPLIYGYDYCALESEHCGKKRHIVCHPMQMEEKAASGNEEFNSEYIMVPMTSKLRNAIVEEHNKVRNSLACGEVPDKDNTAYPPAGHMRELIWDVELEYIAFKHAELCVFEHDECRASSKFPKAGQNLAVRLTTDVQDMYSLVTDFVNQWYEEYKLATVDDVTALKGTPGIGHFTQLANDRVTRVGCAVSKCEQKRPMQGLKIMKYLYSCDYSFVNIYGLATYVKASTPASNCSFVKSAKSSKHKCLCAHSDHTWPLK